MYSNHIVPDVMNTDSIMDNIMDNDTFPTQGMQSMVQKFFGMQQQQLQHQQQQTESSLINLAISENGSMDLSIFGLLSTDPKDEQELEGLDIPLVGEEDQLDHRVPRQISHPMGRNGDGTIIDGGLPFNPFETNMNDEVNMNDDVNMNDTVSMDSFAFDDAQADEPSTLTSAATSPSVSRNGTLNQTPKTPKSQSGDACGRRWADFVLDMKTKQLNRYLKNAALTEAEMNDLKKERRRKLNRKYAKTSRIKKKGNSLGHNVHFTVPQVEDDSENNSDAISEGAYDGDLYAAHMAQRVPVSPFMRLGYGTL